MENPINDTGLLSVTMGRLESELAESFGGGVRKTLENPALLPGGLGIVRYSYCTVCTALPATSAQPQNLPPWFKFRSDRSDFDELVHLRLLVKTQGHALASCPNHEAPSMRRAQRHRCRVVRQRRASSQWRRDMASDYLSRGRALLARRVISCFTRCV